MFGSSKNSHISKLDRVPDGDLILFPDRKTLDFMFWPNRVGGDIPFKNYWVMHNSSPQRYLKFLKELEESHSRHDFLFWVFDIITAGRDRKVFDIQSNILDEAAQHYISSFYSIVKSCVNAENGFFSEYMVKKCPYIFVSHSHAVKCLKNRLPFALSTYKSFDDQLWIYRKTNLGKLVHHIYRKVNINYTFFVNPMENLTLENFPKEQYENLPKFRFKPEDEEYPGYIKNVKYEYEDHDLLPALNYFFEVLTFVGIIPDREEGILVNKNPYKQKQVESFMRKINNSKVFPVNQDDVMSIAENETIVLALIPDEDRLYSYERVQILLDDECDINNEVRVFCVDTGKWGIIPIEDIFIYDFKDFALTSFREHSLMPEEEFERPKVVTLAERIHRNEFPVENLRINDFFVYDSGFTTDETPKYIPFGRSRKPKNFFFDADSSRFGFNNLTYNDF